jgi:bla regulator protein blaR1
VLSYLEIALINALMIIPLALVAESAGRVFRRPAVTHLLWVLILIKLVTPPICQIPLIDRDWVASTSRQLLPQVVFEVDQLEFGSRRSFLADELQNPNSAKLKSRPRSLAEIDKQLNASKSSFTAIAISWIRSENFRQLVMAAVLVVWAVGALVWFVIQGIRCVRFRWSLQDGEAACLDLQRFADRLARRMGLPYSPTVWLMPGVMSPMLWGSGQSIFLIFPERLLDRLDDSATGTLLMHELAHYRRRDHWVRVIELLASGFFWWHPVVWWARREIESVEEECCDAMVVAASPEVPKRYAQAILEVVDFIAERPSRMPALATGLGQVPFLRQRLTWIMRGPRRQDFGYCGRILCLLLTCALPLQPSWLAARQPVPYSVQEFVEPTNRSTVSPVPSGSVANDTGSGGPSETLLAETPISLEHLKKPSSWNGAEIRSQSLDGRFVVFGNQSNQCLFDLETGREFSLNHFAVQAMAFTQNGQEFVTIGAGGMIFLCDVETCQASRDWRIPGGSAKSIDISTDGVWMVTGGRDGIVRIWNRNSEHPVRELPRELGPVNCVRFSPDGELLAVATGDWLTPNSGRIALIEFHSGDERVSMNWNSPATAVGFRADGESLISADRKGRVARWSVANGELMGVSEGHQDLVAAAEFSPNGSPLTEIEIPDLPSGAKWDERDPSVPARWFFSIWGLKPASNQMTSPKPPGM